MNIVTCPACSGKVSAAAASCPHCGHPFAPPQKSVAKGVFWGLFSFFILLPLGIAGGVLALAVFGASCNSVMESQTASQKAAQQEKIDAAARQAVAEQEKIRRQLESEREALDKTPEAIAAREKHDAAEREKQRIAIASEEAERRRIADEEARPARERTAKVISYQLTQASNGLPSFQYEIGKRYMRGDGVETNLTLARLWLQSACTNGLSEATNLLRQIDLQAASK